MRLNEFLARLSARYVLDPGAVERLNREIALAVMPKNAFQPGALGADSAKARREIGLMGSLPSQPSDDQLIGFVVGRLLGETGARYFRAGSYPFQGETGLLGVLRVLGVKPDAVRDLIDQYHGSTYDEPDADVATKLAGHVFQRANWKVLETPPPIPYAEQRVRQALARHSGRLRPDAVDSLAQRWASLGNGPVHDMNKTVDYRLSQADGAEATYSGRPIEFESQPDHYPDHAPAEIDISKAMPGRYSV